MADGEQGTRHDTAETYVGHILLDVPAQDPALRFGHIAKALAGIIQASEPRFAVGIFGGWGSGKSTLMDEIERLVALDKGAMVVRFNAWRFERESHLIIPLLETIRFSLSEWAAQPGHTEQVEKVKDITRRIGRVVRALVRSTSVEIGIPNGPKISVKPGDALDELMAKSGDAADSPESVYYGAFKELTKAFADVRKLKMSRIVVFVDDLDRCLPQQALSVLESMKLFFDMPGFIFVVGLDERVVESAVRTKFVTQPDVGLNDDRRVERDYLKKMFQVPYTLPPMVAGQLDELLRWLDAHGQLAEDQRDDLKKRVRKYLRHVATEGRINPREVKRYINAYTLYRMIRPDLTPEIMLALQTIDFRSDWEQIYEEMVIAEPDVFVEALRRYRRNDDSAFEDIWPDIGVLPLELSEYLRSDETRELSETNDLGRYVSLMETTRSTLPWVPEAMRDVGLLRRHIRSLEPGVAFGSRPALDVAVQVKDVLGRLSSYSLPTYSKTMTATGLNRPLDKLNTLINILAPSATSETEPKPTPPGRLEEWRKEVASEIDALQAGLRMIRRSSAFGP